jgi:hypothetical protein
MFGKSARRTGNIYVAPTELVPSEPKVRIGREFPPLLQSRLAFYVPVGPL